VDWIAESVASATDAAAADLSEGEDAAECFACGRPGRLVLCDRIKCGRSYHLSCAGVRRLPHGRNNLLLSLGFSFIWHR